MMSCPAPSGSRLSAPLAVTHLLVLSQETAMRYLQNSAEMGPTHTDPWAMSSPPWASLLEKKGGGPAPSLHVGVPESTEHPQPLQLVSKHSQAACTSFPKLFGETAVSKQMWSAAPSVTKEHTDGSAWGAACGGDRTQMPRVHAKLHPQGAWLGFPGGQGLRHRPLRGQLRRGPLC